MKLIQQLERKLSWRKKTPPSSPSNSNDCSNVNDNSFHYDKFSRKSKKVQTATIKVADSDFSQYIQFSNQHPSSILCPPLSTIPTYEIVSIRPRTNCHQNQSSKLCDYRSSSPSCKEEYDKHIYQDIEITRQNLKPSSPPPLISPVSVSDNPYSIHNLDYDTFGPTCRRTRIKTNPWLSSPWTTKKNLVQPDNVNSSNDVTIYHNSNANDNHYESIDEWQINKENNLVMTVSPSSAKVLSTFIPLRKLNQTPSNELKSGTFVKTRIPPQHHFDPYPRSPVQIEESEYCKKIDFCIPQAPSPEFVHQSQQLCSEISDYFNPSHLHKPLSSHSDKSCSPLSIQHQGVTKLQQPTIANRSTKPLSLSPTSQSPAPNKRRLPLEQVYGSKAFKRHRPDSIYSPKSKKLDQLKSQLKTVVHAAILEAKKEDTKKA